MRSAPDNGRCVFSGLYRPASRWVGVQAASKNSRAMGRFEKIVVQEMFGSHTFFGRVLLENFLVQVVNAQRRATTTAECVR